MYDRSVAVKEGFYGMGKLKTSTKNYLIALVINPVTTAIIIYMMQNGVGLFNIIGIGIIGYGAFLYFIVTAVMYDVRVYKARKARKKKGNRKKRH